MPRRGPGRHELGWLALSGAGVIRPDGRDRFDAGKTVVATDRDREPRSMTRVLIAVDATEESVHAAEVASRLFGTEAEYLAVSVVDVGVGAGDMRWWDTAWGTSYPVPYGSVWRPTGFVRSVDPAAEAEFGSPTEMARRAAEDTARGAAEESGLMAAETVGEIGDPADVITNAGAEWSADVIVLGTHDRSWFGRLLHGSVGKDVIEHSQVPVLVIPSRGKNE